MRKLLLCNVCFSGRPCVFNDGSNKALPLRLMEKDLSLSPGTLSQGDSCFLLHMEERMNTKLWYLATHQNNRKRHTCRLLASWAGTMTNTVFLVLSS